MNYLYNLLSDTKDREREGEREREMSAQSEPTDNY